MSGYCIDITVYYIDASMKYSRFVTWNIEKHLILFILGMHIVSTLLSRLLFRTICIFNVNIYPIYRPVCFFPCHSTCLEETGRCLMEAALS